MRFLVIVVEKDGKKRGTIKISANTWASAFVKAHDIVQEFKRQEGFTTNWIIKQVKRLGV